MWLKEKGARIVVRLAEKVAVYMTEKASFWTHFQPKEPIDIVPKHKFP